MFRNVHFEGYVIKKKMLLDASYMVTFFTSGHGKLSMVAKGAKKITSKRASHIQTGNKLNFFASKHTSGSWYLGTTSLVSGLASLKSDSSKSAALYNVLQLVDILLPEDQKDIVVFDAFTQFLIKLGDNGVDPKEFTLGFADSLINHLGYGKEM
ncbi:MAG: DNA repair protein RecO [Patescibacteria group bacterium]